MVIMNAKRFNELIDQYDPLNKNIALEFLSISKEYPYFQLPYYYHAKSLKDQGSDQYEKVLNKLALKTLDRSVLKKSMEVEFKPNNSNGENIPIIEADSHEIEEKTEEVFSDKTPEKKEINNLKLSFVEWIKFTEDKTVNVEKKVLGDKKSPLQDKLSIINQFIENDPKISPVKQYENTFSQIKFDDYTDELMTETLAKVLVKQKKYKKAIRAYKILSLKYPEKNVLFATQIEKIKNLE
jgi:hypothetical protein